MFVRLLSASRPSPTFFHTNPIKPVLQSARARTKPPLRTKPPFRSRESARTNVFSPNHACPGPDNPPPPRTTIIAGVILTAIALLNAGCASSPATSFADPFVVQPAGNATEHWFESLADKYRRPVAQLNDLHTTYHEAPTTAAQRRAIRAQFAFELFSIIDEYHENYKIHLHTAVAAGNTLFDTAILGLSSAGNVLAGDGSGASGVISAAVGALSGTRLAVNQNFLNERTTAAIVAQMDALRHEKKAQIISRLQHRTVEEYPLPAVEQDLLEYFYRGSIVNALTALAEDAAVKKSKAGQTLNDLYNSAGVDESPQPTPQ